jgi:hypothetical protein
MQHFSCDHCSKDLTPGQETRYVVRIDVHPAAAPAELTEADLDQDHLDTMAEMLGMMEESPDQFEEPVRRTFEYDLCPNCHARFVADPLGRERARKPQFSKN